VKRSGKDLVGPLILRCTATLLCTPEIPSSHNFRDPWGFQTPAGIYKQRSRIAGPILQRLLTALRCEIWGKIYACTDLGSERRCWAATTSSLWLNVITACSVSQLVSPPHFIVAFAERMAYLGKVPSRPPILPVHQSVAFSVRFTIVITSPFLNPRSPGWSASNVYSATP